jgi:hypothetical protein
MIEIEVEESIHLDELDVTNPSVTGNRQGWRQFDNLSANKHFFSQIHILAQHFVFDGVVMIGFSERGSQQGLPKCSDVSFWLANLFCSHLYSLWSLCCAAMLEQESIGWVAYEPETSLIHACVGAASACFTLSVKRGCVWAMIEISWNVVVRKSKLSSS